MKTLIHIIVDTSDIHPEDYHDSTEEEQIKHANKDAQKRIDDFYAKVKKLFPKLKFFVTNEKVSVRALEI